MDEGLADEGLVDEELADEGTSWVSGMDERLVAWARAVKSRHRHLPGPFIPPLWLFTDPARMPDLLAVLARLPSGLCGVVFRHDGLPGRASLARQVAALCRNRRLALSIAGPGLGLNQPRHLRAARGARPTLTRRGPGPALTASAHGTADLVRARRRRIPAVFLSPAFATASHPGARALGPTRWGALTRTQPTILALGGIDGVTARRLPRLTLGAGAIGALLD